MIPFCFSRNIELGEIIGEGGSGVVHKCQYDGETVAVKKFDGSCTMSNRNEFRREIEILGKISHENIIKLLGYCDERNNTFLIFEYMNGGSLYELLKSERELKWKSGLDIMKKIIKAMIYLHDNNILHLDLKSSNVLLNNTFDIVKLTDFGLSKINNLTSQTTSRKSNTAKGTTRYMSPEIAQAKKAIDESDVWSFGCIILEICTRKLPFSSLDDGALFKILQSNTTPSIPDGIPKVIDKIIKKCLEIDPFERPSFKSLGKLFSTDPINDLLNQPIKIIDDSSKIEHSQKPKTDITQLLSSIFEQPTTSNLEKKVDLLSDKIDRMRLSQQNDEVSNAAYSPYCDSVTSYTHSPTLVASNNTASRRKSNYTVTDTVYVSNGPANGRPLNHGPRGGTFYYTSGGNKRYV